MKRLIALSFVLGLFSACLRLDSNFYNLSDKITEYKWDNYTGEQDFKLGSAYDIADSMHTTFTLNSEGFKIYATYIGDINRIAIDTVILYCHGNKWHMDFYWQRAKLLAHTNGKHTYGVLMLDYRGYGLSEGKPTEAGLYTDVNTTMQWLQSKGLTDNRLILYGFSMGTAPATELTANPRTLRPLKLILEAPFASSAVMAADGAGINVPGSFVTNLKIDNAEEIKKVKQPLCWIHGTNDNFLNIKTHGEVVFKNYSGTYKVAHRIENADHGEVPVLTGFENYLKIMGDFIRKK